MSPVKDHEWFSDGLAEEIINALTHIPGLKVTARTSAFAFRGKEQDISAIAEALRVRIILEGSVRQAGNRVRVTAQLINAEDGYHLWSERYDRELTDIFAIQDDIAGAIAAALRIRLSEKPGAHRRHTPNLPAYEAYLKGRHYLYRMKSESWEKCRQCFEQAIEHDPQFAAAYAGLGEYFFVRGNLGAMPQHEAVRQAHAILERALVIDAMLPEAHALLGMVASVYDHDWDEVAREFRLAMAHEPVTSFVRDGYASFCLLQMGRVAEAGPAIERALQEDPLNLLFLLHKAIYLFAAARDEEAAAQCLQIIDIDQTFFLAYSWLCVTYALQGKWIEARDYAERAFSQVPSPLFAGTFAAVARRNGNERRAEQALEQFKDRDAPGTAVGLAIFYLLCLEIDTALDWFTKAIERRDPMAMLPVVFRRFCASSPRWPTVAKMMNLPG